MRSDTSKKKYEAPHDSNYNDCVMRLAVENVKAGPYCVLGRPGPVENYNCQDWMDAVRAEYQRLINDPDVRKKCGPIKSEEERK